jgi:hypothetical protein
MGGGNSVLVDAIHLLQYQPGGDQKDLIMSTIMAQPRLIFRILVWNGECYVVLGLS